MALATRCPSCHALFRVVADQLKLRGGLVRCGACGQAFDAIGTLSYLDDASLRPAAAPPPPENGSPLTLRIAPGGPGGAPVALHEHAPPAEADAPRAIKAARAEPPAVDEPALLPVEPVSIEAAGPAGDAEAATQSAPEPAPTEVSEASAEAAPAADGEPVESQPEPAFLREARAPRRRAAIVAYATGAALAALALALQLALLLRTELAAQWPAARPALTSLCQALRCSVGWPTRGEMLAVVGSELQSLPGTSVLELTAVVRNRAAVTLALPALEVTLTDTQNRALARRIFGPVDYLAQNEAAARLAAGLEAGADMTVRIVFEAHDLNAAGFVVYPFYL